MGGDDAATSRLVPAEPVQLGDDEAVAAAGDEQGPVQLKAASEFAGHLSMKVSSQPAACRASARLSGFWSRVDTRP